MKRKVPHLSTFVCEQICAPLTATTMNILDKMEHHFCADETILHILYLLCKSVVFFLLLFIKSELVFHAEKTGIQ